MDWINALEKKIEEEKQKISDLKINLQKSESYLQGLQDSLKLVPTIREKRTQSSGNKPIFRAGGSVKKAYDLIKETGRPMGIGEILKGIDKDDTKQNRASLASSLYRSAKKQGGLIIKVDNLFSISELQSNKKEGDLFKLPSNFGKDDRKDVEPDGIPF